jgi:diguanylate cyclase (GGDEF)-like protein
MHISIRQRFSIVFVLLILLPALALGGATIRLVRQSIVEQMEREQRLLLQSIHANVVERHVEDMEKALGALARDRRLPQMPGDEGARREIVEQWRLTRVLFPERSWIYYGTTENEIFVSPEWNAPAGYDCRTRPWFREARAAGDIVWVEPYREYVSRELVMSAATPIYGTEGEFRGVLSMDMHMTGFLQLLKQAAGTRTPQIVAVGESGTTFMLNEAEDRSFDLTAEEEWADMAELDGAGTYLRYDGDRTYYATLVDVPRLRLKLVSLVPADALYAETRPILWTLVGITASFVAVSLVAGSYFSRHFIANIERLNHYMNAVASGDYRIRQCVTSRDEFRQLNDRLNTMVGHLARSIRSLELESSTDALCGIRNRRYLIERLNAYISHDSAEWSPVSIVLLDIDDFKSVNDSFGHTTGDEVLRRVATIMRAAFPEHAIVGRYGGEEFMAILPGTPSAETVEIAERFRSTLAAQSWREQGLGVTISGGVAERQDGDEPERLVHRADRALYSAKRSGKNCIVAAAAAGAARRG